MAKYHFVEEYEALVARLMREHPIDRAMEMAVGGSYDKFGAIQADILAYVGIQDGQFVFDLGCGSGRLAHALSKRFQINYLGTDVVAPLLQYAASKSAKNYIFVLHRQLTVPAPDASVDIACAFSVFTHLLHDESYIYLEGMRRALKPRGRIIFSFLEFGAPAHWRIFKDTVEAQRQSQLPHLNTFIERSAIDAWSRHLDLSVVEFIDGSDKRWSGQALGQSLVILEKATTR